MPSATAREFQKVATQLGFTKSRQTGSHERWTRPDGRAVTIALHGGKEIGPPLAGSGNSETAELTRSSERPHTAEVRRETREQPQ